MQTTRLYAVKRLTRTVYAVTPTSPAGPTRFVKAQENAHGGGERSAVLTAFGDELFGWQVDFTEDLLSGATLFRARKEENNGR